jgi:hypothetical protein
MTQVIDMTGQKPDIVALYNFLKVRGSMFEVTFIKRTNGEVRHMNARIGVKKYLKAGGELKFNPFERGLIPVYDVQVKEVGKGYRFINVNDLINVTVDGDTLKFQEDPDAEK